jgi:hypothetical protein
MSDVEAWANFWQILLMVVFTLFYGLVLFIIPFGFRDILTLFRELKAQSDTNDQ